jgi:hypothetical protein
MVKLMIWIRINGEKVKVTLKNREQLKESYYKEYPLDTPVELLRHSKEIRVAKVIRTLPLSKVFDYIRKCW